LVCLLESLYDVGWLFSESLGALFCQPSLFGYVGLPARLAKFFTLWFWFWVNIFGLGYDSALAYCRDDFGFYVQCHLA